MILGLDTSTSAITVAVGRLHDDGDVTIQDRRSIIDARAHTEHLAPLIAASLSAVDARPADLRHIVVGTGPGPFTGLRVGLVTAVTMGAALGVPVYGICSLVVATDARRKEVYWARYTLTPGASARYVSVTAPAVERPGELPQDLADLPVVGRGSALYPAVWARPLDLSPDVDAGVLLSVAGPRIASGEDLPVVPLYLRRPDALTTAERSAGR